MLYTYSIANQTVAVNAPIQFTTVGLVKNKNVLQSTETTKTITCPGVYEVSFNGTATAAGTVQLYLNGEEVAGALSTGTTLALTTLISVNPNCCAITTNLPARLQVINTGAAELTLSNVGLTIIKVG